MSDDKPAPTYADDTVLLITFKNGTTERLKVMISVFHGNGQEVVMSYNCMQMGSTVLYRDYGQEEWHARKRLKDRGKVTITIVVVPNESGTDSKRPGSKRRFRRGTVSN